VYTVPCGQQLGGVPTGRERGQWPTGPTPPPGLLPFLPPVPGPLVVPPLRRQTPREKRVPIGQQWGHTPTGRAPRQTGPVLSLVPLVPPLPVGPDAGLGQRRQTPPWNAVPLGQQCGHVPTGRRDGHVLTVVISGGGRDREGAGGGT
jgi:hypothetical protein